MVTKVDGHVLLLVLDLALLQVTEPKPGVLELRGGEEVRQPPLGQLVTLPQEDASASDTEDADDDPDDDADVGSNRGLVRGVHDGLQLVRLDREGIVQLEGESRLVVERRQRFERVGRHDDAAKHVERDVADDELLVDAAGVRRPKGEVIRRKDARPIDLDDPGTDDEQLRRPRLVERAVADVLPAVEPGRHGVDAGGSGDDDLVVIDLRQRLLLLHGEREGAQVPDRLPVVEQSRKAAAVRRFGGDAHAADEIPSSLLAARKLLIVQSEVEGIGLVRGEEAARLEQAERPAVRKSDWRVHERVEVQDLRLDAVEVDEKVDVSRLRHIRKGSHQDLVDGSGGQVKLGGRHFLAQLADGGIEDLAMKETRRQSPLEEKGDYVVEIGLLLLQVEMEKIDVFVDLSGERLFFGPVLNAAEKPNNAVDGLVVGTERTLVLSDDGEEPVLVLLEDEDVLLELLDLGERVDPETQVDAA